MVPKGCEADPLKKPVVNSSGNIVIELTKDEAKAILHCLGRTSAKGKELTIGMMLEDEIVKLIR